MSLGGPILGRGRLGTSGGEGSGGGSGPLPIPVPSSSASDPTLTITHLGDEYLVPRDQRKGLEFDNTIPGGDHSLRWSMPCDVVGRRGLPPLAGDIVLRWGSQHIWEGLLVGRKVRTKKGRMTGLVDFEAIGYYQCLDFKRHLSALVYGPPETGGSPMEDKISVADLPTILAHTISQNNQFLFNYDSDPLMVGGVGIPLSQDSQLFSGQNSLDVLNWVAALVSYLSNPYIWQVKPRLIGGIWSPYFFFQPMETGPLYWDDGESEGEYDYDIRRHPNRVTVEWGNKQRVNAPLLTDPLDYTTFGGRSLTIDKYVRMATEYQGLADVEALAAGYLSLFSALKASGSVTVKEPLRKASESASGWERIAPILLRSGHVIQCQNNLEGESGTRYITGMSWREDSCTSTLTIGELSGLYGEIRRLVSHAGAASISWSMALGGLSTGIGSGEGQGVGIIGQTYTPAPVSSGDPRVGVVAVTAALTDGTHDFGPGGGKVLPDNLPTRFFGPMQQFRTTDGSPIAEANNVARAPSLDWKNLNAYQILSKESATMQIKVHKNGALVVTADLTAGTNSGIIAISPWSTVKGDALTYDIVANNNSSDASIIIYGEADHPGYPSNLYPIP